jgi:hypothetical protein
MWSLLAMVAFPLAVVAQTGSPGSSGTAPGPSAYQPAVPAPSVVNAYGGYPGYSGGGTVGGNAMQGMASVISAKGSYNLSTSAAAINMTQAERNEIQNRDLATSTYFQMRAMNRSANKAERNPSPSMEQLARIDRQLTPGPLSPKQFDAVSGKLRWPGPLQDASFAAERGEIDDLMAKRSSGDGLGYADWIKVRETVDAMGDALKEQVKDLPPQDYVASRKFLRQLAYAASKSESAE